MANVLDVCDPAIGEFGTQIAQIGQVAANTYCEAQGAIEGRSWILE